MRVTDKRVRRNSVAEPGERFALPADYEHCRRIHRHYGTSYYLASRLLPKETRMKVDALYGFVRVPDEWVDNPGTMTKAEQRAKQAAAARAIASVAATTASPHTCPLNNVGEVSCLMRATARDGDSAISTGAGPVVWISTSYSSSSIGGGVVGVWEREAPRGPASST
jgi:hypothetical protein